jgi:hypothetical protein
MKAGGWPVVMCTLRVLGTTAQATWFWEQVNCPGCLKLQPWGIRRKRGIRPRKRGRKKMTRAKLHMKFRLPSGGYIAKCQATGGAVKALRLTSFPEKVTCLKCVQTMGGNEKEKNHAL